LLPASPFIDDGAVQNSRLAWEGARVLVAVADRDDGRLYDWLADRLDLLCGPEYPQALSISRTRLMYRMRDDAPMVEAGMWRARLHDLLDHRPDLARPFRALVDELTPIVYPS
jgi:hypothetical protein